MTLKLYPENAVQNIADAIRAKNGLSTTYTINEMASAISNIPSGGSTSLVSKTVTPASFLYYVTPNSTSVTTGKQSVSFAGGNTNITIPYMFKWHAAYIVSGTYKIYNPSDTSILLNSYQIPTQYIATGNIYTDGGGPHQIYCKNSDGTRQNTCFWPLGLNTTTTNTNTLRIYSYASSGTGCIQIDLDVLELPADYVAGFYNNDGLSSQLTADFSSFNVGDTLLIIGYLGYLDGSTFRTTRMEGVVEWTGNDLNLSASDIKYTGYTQNSSYFTSIQIKPNLSSNNIILSISNSPGVGNFLLYRQYQEVENYDGISQVTVEPIPSQYIIPSGVLSITEGGTYDVTSYATASVTVGEDKYTKVLDRTISGNFTTNLSFIGNHAFTMCSLLSGLSATNCTSIDTYAFQSCSNLKFVDIPNCEIIGTSAFVSCTSLSSINAGNCLSIASNAFYYCDLSSATRFPKCQYVGDYAFYHCMKITDADFPSCTYVGRAAFYMSNLFTISFPVCVSMATAAFMSARITTADFPSCTSIAQSAFASCYSLKTVNFPLATYVASTAFNYCYSLEAVDFPLATTVGNSAFYACSVLSSISFRSCRQVGSNAFAFCSSIATIDLPSCSTVGSFAFRNCFSASIVSLPMCSSIYASAFLNCYNLLSLYLMGSSLCTLGGVNAFSSTPISNYTDSTGGVYGSIFVPASLYDSYISATNWITYSDRFVSV